MSGLSTWQCKGFWIYTTSSMAHTFWWSRCLALYLRLNKTQRDDSTIPLSAYSSSLPNYPSTSTMTFVIRILSTIILKLEPLLFPRVVNLIPESSHSFVSEILEIEFSGCSCQRFCPWRMCHGSDDHSGWKSFGGESSGLCCYWQTLLISNT